MNIEEILKQSEGSADAINTIRTRENYEGIRGAAKKQLLDTLDQMDSRPGLLLDYANAMAVDEVLKGLAEYASPILESDENTLRMQMFAKIIENINISTVNLEKSSNNSGMSEAETLTIRKSALDKVRNFFRSKPEFIQALDDALTKVSNPEEVSV